MFQNNKRFEGMSLRGNWMRREGRMSLLQVVFPADGVRAQPIARSGANCTPLGAIVCAVKHPYIHGHVSIYFR